MDKKQYNSIWAGSLALLLLAGSCSKSDETAAPEPADGRIVVRALASDSWQAPSFDRFGLYIVQKAAEGSEALAGERLHANVEFTRSGDTYVSTPAIAFPGAKKLRFDLYAYAPYRETALEAGAVTLPLALAADQQDDAAYTAADLRFSKRTNYAAVTGDVAMEFVHAMSRIDIVLKAGYGYTLDDFASAGVVLKGLKNEGAFSFVDGGSTTSGAAADIAPHGTLTRQDDCLEGLSAIVIPQNAAAGEPLVEITANGERFEYSPSETFVLQSGKRHTLTLVLSRSFEGVTVQTDVTVTDWLPGGEESMNGEEILPPTGTTVEDGDGNSYGIIRIGRQYWMDENLHTTKYNDGTAIAHITDGKEWQRYTGILIFRRRLLQLRQRRRQRRTLRLALQPRCREHAQTLPRRVARAHRRRLEQAGFRTGRYAQRLRLLGRHRLETQSDGRLACGRKGYRRERLWRTARRCVPRRPQRHGDGQVLLR